MRLPLLIRVCSSLPLGLHLYCMVKPHFRKIPENSDTQKFAVITLKVDQDGFYLRVMHTKDAEEIANSINPDQTAPLGAVWSGSALFAQTCLSGNLGTIRYSNFRIITATPQVFFSYFSGVWIFQIFTGIAELFWFALQKQPQQQST